MEHLLKLSSLAPDEIIHILDVADEYKRLHKAGTDPKDLQGKAVALMFGKHSTRTRTSLEVGIYQMGGLGTYLSAADMQIARASRSRIPPACWAAITMLLCTAPLSRVMWTPWPGTAACR